MDCVVVRSVTDMQAERATLKTGVEQALRAPQLHGGRNRGACAGKLRLRDALITAAQELGQLPGRRVILAITDGLDGSSTQTWDAVQAAMQRNGVTVFGLASTSTGTVSSLGRGPGPLLVGGETAKYEAAFDSMCQTSGGLVLTARDLTLKAKLAEFTQLLRARYIVQFPRPASATSGSHLMSIEVVGKKYFVRCSGASVPIADPKLKDDPTVVQGLGGPGS